MATAGGIYERVSEKQRGLGVFADSRLTCCCATKIDPRAHIALTASFQLVSQPTESFEDVSP
jgi:hypothetical protein